MSEPVGDNRRGRSVCLVSTAPVWINPRAVKEADALHAAGYDVTLVTRNVDAAGAEKDDRLLAAKPWRAVRIQLSRQKNPRAWLAAGIRSRIAALLSKRFPGSLRLQEELYYRGYGPVLREASRRRADIYMAHTQGALPIAARAAARHHVPYSFDCEDLLAEERADGLASPEVHQAIVSIERHYLPGAAYVSATGQCMAEYLADQYHIRKPLVVYNVFPKSELAGIPAPADRPPSSRRRIVWMSATIGANRGIEDAMRALGALPEEFELHLFGTLAPAFESVFEALLDSEGIRSRVSVTPLPPPPQVMQTIAQYDIGLALESNECINRAMCTSNKLFLYLQSGLAIAATDTPGQKEVLNDVPGLGFVHAPGDWKALADGLSQYLDAGALQHARTAAWEAGQSRYCWDAQKQIIVAAVNRAIDGDAAHPEN